MAAVVSMAELKRIEGQQDVEDISVNGVRKHRHWFGPSELGARTLAEAGALAADARGDDPFGYRQEAVQMMRVAESLSR